MIAGRPRKRPAPPGVVFQEMTVQRVTQSPLNPKQWCLDLQCGHHVWVTSKSRPQRMKATCTTCVRVVS